MLANTKNLGLLGAGLVAVGVFLPVVSMPLVGSVSFIGNAHGGGLLTLIAAAAFVVFGLRQQRIGLLVAASVSALMIGVSFLVLWSRIHDVKSGLARVPFGGLLAQTVQIGWGWLFLFAGVGLTIYAAWNTPTRSRSEP